MLIAADRLWSDGRLSEGVAVEVAGGAVVAVRPLGRDSPDARVALLLPALSDLQVNGGGGVMANSDPTPEGFRAIAAAHRRLGTGAVLVTVITDAPEVMEAAAEAAIASAGRDGVLGLHLEGPHIAPSRRGTHAAGHIRPLDARTVAVVARLRAQGVPVLVTLAPERADPGLLAQLAATGAVLSAGHSAATAAEARAGFAAGIGCVTHLYNAMEPMLSRAPGLAAAAILSDAFVGLIADGVHVSWEMLALALAARPPGGRSFLVSDAMATVGGPESFTLYGREIRVVDGVLRNAEGALAGAHLDMVTALRNVHLEVGVPLGRAVAMATDVPRAVLGLPRQRIEAGTPVSELIALDGDLRLTPLP